MDDDQFSQLQTQIQTLGGRMDDMTGRMDDMTARMDDMTGRMSDMTTQMGTMTTRMDGFDRSLARMYAHMEKRFDHLEATKADKTDFQRIYNQLDGLIKRIDGDRIERTAMISQLNRHERWHQQTAEHLGLDLA